MEEREGGGKGGWGMQAREWERKDHCMGGLRQRTSDEKEGCRQVGDRQVV